MRKGASGCIARTDNWSPLKSPNATTLPSGSRPMEPASMRELPVNRFGGKGHIDVAGEMRLTSWKTVSIHLERRHITAGGKRGEHVMIWNFIGFPTADNYGLKHSLPSK